MTMKITKDIETRLIKNSKLNMSADGETIDFKPVVKFFGGSACTWLLTEYDPETNLYFGLCDLGFGSPEIGYVSKDELEALRFPPFRLPIEIDRYFEADKTLGQYADEARNNGRIAA